MSDPINPMDGEPGLLARNVILLRAHKGVSQAALAESAGLSRTTISNLERGEGSPTYNVMRRIAFALDVKVGALLEERQFPERVSDEEIARLAEGSPSSEGIDPRMLAIAVDEAAGHSLHRYSPAGRPRAASR